MTRELRVLCLTHAFPRDAQDPVGLFVLQLVQALETYGIRTRVVAPAAPGVPLRDTIGGVPVRRYRYAPESWETLAYTGTMSDQVRQSLRSRAAFLGMLASGVRAAAAEAREHRCDLVHAHWWIPGGLVGAMATSLRRLPLVTTMHGSDVRLLASPPARWLFRKVARRSAALTAVSTWLAESAARAGDRPVTVAPMPVRSAGFPPGAAERELRLLFVGKLAPQKGLHLLLRAMARCRSRPRLDVVGAGRVDDAALRSLAAELNLADRVTWLPILPQEQLAALYRTAAALVVPAIDEGLGLTAVEAALSETPVIAFASGGLPDCVLDGQTGTLVAPGDVDGLAAAIDAVAAGPALARQMGRAGRVFALERFSERAVADRYATLFREAVGLDAAVGGAGDRHE